MSSTASPHPDGGLDVVVDADGALHVSADELARYGVRAGSHLRIIPDQRRGAPRRSVRGALAGMLNPDDVDELIAALDESKAERIATIEQRWT